jgi:hypothetical protein
MAVIRWYQILVGLVLILEIEFSYVHTQKESLISQRNSVLLSKLDAIGLTHFHLWKPLISSTVQVAQKQRLCRAFPFAFGAFPNIFWKESTYFFQYLPFNFLAGRWLCNVSNLMRFSKFQLKFGTVYCIQNLYLH